MKQIAKSSEPRCLTTHRASKHASYANLPEDCKQKLRELLVCEQQGLCCYCMSRITASFENMKIEHWSCQNGSSSDLQYGNLIGSCLGNQGQPGKLQHCDSKKGSSTLSFNPANAADAVESRIRYEGDGSIRSHHVQFDSELSNVLNLNVKWLKSNRKAMLDGVIEWWKNERGRLKGPVPKASFQQRRAIYSQPGTELTPFSQVAVWWIDQRLSRMKK